MPGPINLGGDAAADFAASLAEAAGAPAGEEDTSDEQGGADDSEGVQSDDEPAGDAGGDASDDGEGDDSDAEDGEDSDDEEDGDDESGAAGADREAVARELGQLLVDNPKEFFKRTGLDPKVLKINLPKFQAMRAGLKEARDLRAAVQTKETELAAERTRVETALAQGKAKYGPFVDLANALKAEDYLAAKEILEGLAPAGKTFQDIAAGIVLAAKNQSPSELAYRKLLREQQARQRAEAEAKERQEAETKAKEQETALAQKNLNGATAKLKGTKFEGIPLGPETLVRLYSENWDFQRGGLKVTPAQIMKLFEADPVIKQGLELKALKAKSSKLPPARDRNKPGRSRDGSGKFVPGGAPSGGTGKREKPGAAPKADPDAELRAAMAEADRLERAASRKASAGKGRR